MVVYGAKILYFTGKFEVYLRHKGLPYEFRPLDCRRHLAVRRRLGATQYPTVRLDDGRWTRTSGSHEHASKGRWIRIQAVARTS